LSSGGAEAETSLREKKIPRGERDWRLPQESSSDEKGRWDEEGKKKGGKAESCGGLPVLRARRLGGPVRGGSNFFPSSEKWNSK